METINKWVVLITLALALFLVSTLYQYKNRAEVLQNQVATLDTMYQDAQIMIQESTLDLKECQKSYDELLLELDLTADSLVECRKAQTKVVSPRKAGRFTKFVKN